MPHSVSWPIRGNKFSVTASFNKHISSTKTPFQTIDFYETPSFGKLLLLDGHIQLTELDEAVYHEGLVQIPLCNLAEPTSALVIGGGDGGTIRELCRSKSITKIKMVEIDEGVIKASLKDWPGLSNGAFDDPRLDLTLGDAFKWIKSASGKYDLIVADSTDSYEDEVGELSEQLFTEKFFTDLKKLLAPGGIVVTQADNPVFCPYSLEQIVGIFNKVFRCWGWYWVPIPSFGGASAYVWGSNDIELKRSYELAPQSAPNGCKWLNAENYNAAFGDLPYNIKRGTS